MKHILTLIFIVLTHVSMANNETNRHISILNTTKKAEPSKYSDEFYKNLTKTYAENYKKSNPDPDKKENIQKFQIKNDTLFNLNTKANYHSIKAYDLLKKTVGSDPEFIINICEEDVDYLIGTYYITVPNTELLHSLLAIDNNLISTKKDGKSVITSNNSKFPNCKLKTDNKNNSKKTTTKNTDKITLIAEKGVLLENVLWELNATSGLNGLFSGKILNTNYNIWLRKDLNVHNESADKIISRLKEDKSLIKEIRSYKFLNSKSPLTPIANNFKSSITVTHKETDTSKNKIEDDIYNRYIISRVPENTPMEVYGNCLRQSSLEIRGNFKFLPNINIHRKGCSQGERVIPKIYDNCKRMELIKQQAQKDGVTIEYDKCTPYPVLHLSNQAISWDYIFNSDEYNVFREENGKKYRLIKR